MRTDIETELGVHLMVNSSYRSYEDQEAVYNDFKNISLKYADAYAARPGHSEHQTGLAFDVGKLDDKYGETKEGIWLAKNAHLYGFIIRYPKGKENITGYQYEPWHIRYVGTPLASELYNNGNWISLEEYYGITSTYNY